MENYDEKMNYSFEPAPEEPSRPPLEQAKEEIRRSGKRTGLKIAALLAALAIPGAAYYAIWAMAAVIFALAVYYTVKQL